jgi:hypothetical protein
MQFIASQVRFAMTIPQMILEFALKVTKEYQAHISLLGR